MRGFSRLGARVEPVKRADGVGGSDEGGRRDDDELEDEDEDEDEPRPLLELDDDWEAVVDWHRACVATRRDATRLRRRTTAAADDDAVVASVIVSSRVCQRLESTIETG